MSDSSGKQFAGVPGPHVDVIAQVVHEAIRAFRKASGQDDIGSWARAPKWMKQATADTVTYVLQNPEIGPEAIHDHWMKSRVAAGWRYGAVKDARKKTHPLLVPYDELSDIEKRKDHLIAAVASALDR